MQVVPGGYFRGRDEISLMESTMGAVGLMSETHRMLIELCHWHHLLKVSVVGEVILNRRTLTAWVVTP